MPNPNIVVLGTGMAGFGAAYRLHAEGIIPAMYDKNNYHGGHTASFRYDSGFLFDVGPHISYTKDPRIQELFADSVHQQYQTLQVSLNNYWRGHWPKHPVQLHLHGLPEDVVVKIIADFVIEHQTPDRQIKNYADWLLTSFGRTFAELFPMQYTRKYHTTTADNMTTDWLGTGVKYVWLGWSDSGAISHTVAPTASRTYTATFGTRYYLTMTTGTGGTVSPASGWRNAGSTVSINATPTNNNQVSYSFAGWTGSGPGSYSGTNNPASIRMNGPITENAAFSQNPVHVTVQTNPAGLTFSVDGTNYTSVQSFSWQPGSTHTIATTSPQNGGTHVRYVWMNWSGGGTISHTVAPATNINYTRLSRPNIF